MHSPCIRLIFAVVCHQFEPRCRWSDTRIASESERLDLLLQPIWEQALSGKLRYVDRVLKIEAARCRLLGLHRAACPVVAVEVPPEVAEREREIARRITADPHKRRLATELLFGSDVGPPEPASVPAPESRPDPTRGVTGASEPARGAVATVTLAGVRPAPDPSDGARLAGAGETAAVASPSDAGASGAIEVTAVQPGGGPLVAPQPAPHGHRQPGAAGGRLSPGGTR